MKKPSVFLTRKIDAGATQRIEEFANVEVWPHDGPPTKAVLKDKISSCDGILSLLTDPLDQDVISSARPGFKIISQMAVGTDNIDLSTATQMNIPVGHTPGVLTETCADFTWALIMSISRRIVEAHNQVHQGIWKPWGPEVLVGHEVFGSVLGIVGLGRIGKAVARRARGFNMRILYTARNRQPDAEKELGVEYRSLDSLLEEADYVSVHTYLSKDTYHLFDDAVFRKMKPGAILINTSRGGVVDPDALYKALVEKRIAGAALDVFEPEPIPQDNPLLSMDNVIITPHIASASNPTRQQMAHITVDNLIAGLKGERLPFCANPQVYR